MSSDFRDNVNIIPQSIGFVKGFFEKSRKNSKNSLLRGLFLVALKHDSISNRFCEP